MIKRLSLILFSLSLLFQFDNQRVQANDALRIGAVVFGSLNDNNDSPVSLLALEYQGKEILRRDLEKLQFSNFSASSGSLNKMDSSHDQSIYAFSFEGEKSVLIRLSFEQFGGARKKGSTSISCTFGECKIVGDTIILTLKKESLSEKKYGGESPKRLIANLRVRLEHNLGDDLSHSIEATLMIIKGVGILRYIGLSNLEKQKKVYCTIVGVEVKSCPQKLGVRVNSSNFEADPNYLFPINTPSLRNDTIKK